MGKEGRDIAEGLLWPASQNVEPLSAMAQLAAQSSVFSQGTAVPGFELPEPSLSSFVMTQAGSMSTALSGSTVRMQSTLTGHTHSHRMPFLLDGGGDVSLSWRDGGSGASDPYLQKLLVGSSGSVKVGKTDNVANARRTHDSFAPEQKASRARDAPSDSKRVVVASSAGGQASGHGSHLTRASLQSAEAKKLESCQNVSPQMMKQLLGERNFFLLRNVGVQHSEAFLQQKWDLHRLFQVQEQLWALLNSPEEKLCREWQAKHYGSVDVPMSAHTYGKALHCIQTLPSTIAAALRPSSSAEKRDFKVRSSCSRVTAPVASVDKQVTFIKELLATYGNVLEEPTIGQSPNKAPGDVDTGSGEQSNSNVPVPPPNQKVAGVSGEYAQQECEQAAQAQLAVLQHYLATVPALGRMAAAKVGEEGGGDKAKAVQPMVEMVNGIQRDLSAKTCLDMHSTWMANHAAGCIQPLAESLEVPDGPCHGSENPLLGTSRGSQQTEPLAVRAERSGCQRSESMPVARSGRGVAGAAVVSDAKQQREGSSSRAESFLSKRRRNGMGGGGGGGAGGGSSAAGGLKTGEACEGGASNWLRHSASAHKPGTTSWLQTGRRKPRCRTQASKASETVLPCAELEAAEEGQLSSDNSTSLKQPQPGPAPGAPPPPVGNAARAAADAAATEEAEASAAGILCDMAQHCQSLPIAKDVRGGTCS